MLVFGGKDHTVMHICCVHNIGPKNLVNHHKTLSSLPRTSLTRSLDTDLSGRRGNDEKTLRIHLMRLNPLRGHITFCGEWRNPMDPVSIEHITLMLTILCFICVRMCLSIPTMLLFGLCDISIVAGWYHVSLQANSGWALEVTAFPAMSSSGKSTREATGF